jgi:hypothetical protein
MGRRRMEGEEEDCRGREGIKRRGKKKNKEGGKRGVEGKKWRVVQRMRIRGGGWRKKEEENERRRTDKKRGNEKREGDSEIRRRGG